MDAHARALPSRKLRRPFTEGAKERICSFVFPSDISAAAVHFVHRSEGQAADHFLTEIPIDFSTVMSWIQNIIPIIPTVPALSP